MRTLINRVRSVYEDDTIGAFLTLMLLFGVAVGIFTGVLNNYLYEILAIDRVGRGIVEFPRELPGLLLFVLVGLMHHFTEKRMLRTAFVISTGGLLLLVLFGPFQLAFLLAAILTTVGIALSFRVAATQRSVRRPRIFIRTGISVDHLISIVIAIAGGILWERLGMETLFTVAAFFGVGSAVFSFTLPRVRVRTRS